MDVGYTVDHKRTEFLGESLDGRSVGEIEEVFNTTDLVSENLALRIVFEMTITFETTLNEFPELLSKGVVVKEVMYTKT